MAQGNDNRNDVVYSKSFTEETTNTQRRRLVAGTLTYTPLELPNIPVDLLPEILCRLPVKLLIQLRCLCKFFNSLISDPKFAKKHLQLSTKRHHLMLTNLMLTNDDEFVIYDSPIPSPFSTSTVVTRTQLYPPNGHHWMGLLCSCDGVFCGQLNDDSYFLWNPSVRKFKLLPPLESDNLIRTLSFGYDHFVDNYKVIIVSDENEVRVNTLGTDYWTRIQDIPYSDPICGDGVFVSSTLNWFASDVIISLHLENESYQKLCPPDFGDENHSRDFGVLRDYLCVFASSDEYWVVWIMKGYGNQESGTKLYSVPNLQDQDLEGSRALYISEDDQLLVECCELEVETGYNKLVVYDSKTGTLNIPEFQNKYDLIYSNVYIESLISP